MLKVEGLNAGYGSVNILWDIGFEVKDGEIVAILGSNGAGKTTMVRTITGMVKASSGKVEFNGEDLSGKSSRVILDSGIVQVPEGRQLFTEMTVLENLELGAFNKETKAHFAENLEKCYNWFPKLRERAKQAVAFSPTKGLVFRMVFKMRFARFKIIAVQPPHRSKNAEYATWTQSFQISAQATNANPSIGT